MSVSYSPLGSRKAIIRAGRSLRDAWNDDAEWLHLVTSGQFDDVWTLAWAFRAELQVPLTKVVMGLRSMTKTIGAPDALVAQRLKRMPTILFKLGRFPNMNLTTMQDIAGCRVILDSQAEVRRLLARIHHNGWDVQNIDDYVVDPKPDGYRAVHVIVLRDHRLVEIQLRTVWQHAWARSVEALDLVHGHGLKEGRGPQVLRDLLAASAYAVETTGSGGALPHDFDQTFQSLHRQAAEYLRRR